MSGGDALQKVTTSDYRLPNPADNRHITCPAKLYDVMLQCWQIEPNDRPSFDELHQFFNQYCAELDAPYQLEEDVD